MKKDEKSYHTHDAEYNSELNSYEATLKVIKNYDDHKQFENLGFALALSLTTKMPATHIDVGSGNGWLLRKMSPHFKKVIGIEPSKTGSELSLKINKENTNVSVVNKDMVDGLEYLSPVEPVFMTSSTVLNHIENFYVAEFLKRVNHLPIGSVLFFDERYDKNIDWTMWHVRSKDWWMNNLPNWQMQFLNLDVAGYPSGIYGTLVGKENLIKMYKMSGGEKIYWSINGAINIILRIVKKSWRVVTLQK